MSAQVPSYNPDALAQADAVMSEDSWPRTVNLASPITLGKSTIDELVFQRGTLAVLKGLNIAVNGMPNVDQLIAIAARLSEQPLRVIESLAPGDVQEVLAIALGFFGRSLGGGKTP